MTTKRRTIWQVWIFGESPKDLRFATEAEAVTRDRAALAERWADAKRTQGSVMHDVAGVMAVVDALLGALP